MRIAVEGLELDVTPGVTTARIVEFARHRGVALPDRPWCGPTRLSPAHEAGSAPLVAFARLTSGPGPDVRPRPGAHLAVVGGPGAGAVRTLADGLVVGRSREADLELNDPTVGTLHAQFRGNRVRDLGSTNGIVARGRRVRGRSKISPGDSIRLGESLLIVVPDAGTPGAFTAPGAGGDGRPKTRAIPGFAGGAAAVSMAAFAIVTGHWPLAAVAVLVPLATLGMRRLRRGASAAVTPLLDATGTLDTPPLPSGPIAVSGPRGLVRAVTLATGRPETSAPHWEPWMGLLAPATHDVTWVAHPRDAPSWALVVIEARGRDLAVTAHGTTAVGPLPLVTEANAAAAARRIAARAVDDALPTSVRWAELPPPREAGLVVRLGMGARGPVALDLVADGPHLLVAGTTGAGKSEALRTIVGSLAHDYSPREVAFALIDFKGGAGLGDCARLPHVASTLTDLEPHLARRCLLALAAELADRKRRAAAASAAAFDEWREGRPPRLVVVVDEFQEIAASDRDFLPELARLAAQGRSLGIHVVLATQRPAGSVGAAIRANIGATIALRTASDAESRDLIGSDAAARLPVSTPGRAVLARGGTVEEVQIALPLRDPPAAIRVVGEPVAEGRNLFATSPHAHLPRAEPLWRPPLPSRIASPPRPRDFTLGATDAPHIRARAPLVWDPAAGPAVIAGGPRSGRTTALASVAAIAVELGMTPVWVPRDPRLAVRTLARAVEAERVVLLLDDCAHTLAAATTADPEAVDLLAAALLRLPAALVVPVSWSSHRLVAGASLRLLATGISTDDDAAWSVPLPLRGLPATQGRVRAGTADGWVEAQLVLPHKHPQGMPLIRPLPRTIAGPLPRHAIGIGSDASVPVLAPVGPAAVVGPPGAEREAVARRVSIATGTAPMVLDNGFTLGAPGTPMPRTVVCVRPSNRTIREVARDVPRGLLEAAPMPFRAVAVIDGVAQAVQVLPG